MITIHKIQLGIIHLPSTFNLMLPKDAEILDIQLQRNSYVMWYKCDTAAPLQDRVFYAAGTGEPFTPKINCKWKYIKTIQEYLSGLVYHFFVSIYE